jgi:anti-sigma regulatory factor (Ser/Thr protein kinase)
LLREWGLGELVDVTELLVAELMTNALTTTTKHCLDTPIRWRLSANHAQVLIEVWDADPTPPPAPSAEPPPSNMESGRGLFLVDALSTRWSWYAVPAVRGKVVWAEVSS